VQWEMESPWESLGIKIVTPLLDTTTGTNKYSPLL
jgi:hypothetical protein